MNTKPVHFLTSLSVGLVLLLATQGGLARLTAAPSQATAAATTAAPGTTVHLKIGYSTWVGYGPLFIAPDKGYLTPQGPALDSTKHNTPHQRFTALPAN